MIKTILKFLIALIAPSTLTVLYLFSETRIVQAVSTDSNGELLKTLLRAGLGVSGVIIFALSYWVCILKDKETELQTKLDKFGKPTFTEVTVNSAYFKPTIEGEPKEKSALPTAASSLLDSSQRSFPGPKIPVDKTPKSDFDAAYERLMKLTKQK